MLQDFLEDNRDAILRLCDKKSTHLAGLLGTSEQLKAGLPLFYEQLIMILKERIETNSSDDMLSAAAMHGKEFLRLGYSLSHVVHAYGAMCQAITEIATQTRAHISPREFNVLNACLDVAISTAVSEFQFRSNEANEEREIQHLGFLAHELRNALSSATVAHEMIKLGIVGTGGSTSAVLELNFARMRNLIDRSLSEVRMRADAEVFVEKFRLSQLIDQIVVTEKRDAMKRNQSISLNLDWRIEVESDRQFIMSAIANLVQNALKYTIQGGSICLRTKETADRVLIEIEDQCGGLDPKKMASLFEPYVQEHSNRSGLGLDWPSLSKPSIYVREASM
ncbi:MAG: hypothetical protein COV44_07545 [Deltaproteobacteria bacterium CG11_big_fil_rev_8_21_14_0_20_45_16]|nr:MAG: hypothetical protein COV44_07545 [Deltaproteobacteria bacterium CG11_big_fil_rev_8_21_14_0_20_45_16]